MPTEAPAPPAIASEPLAEPAVRGRRVKGHVCMVAYTDYRIDARVRREAETLASNEFGVVCLTTKNGGTPARFNVDGVEVRELGVPKYRGKSTFAYTLSYLRFLGAASVVCL